MTYSYAFYTKITPFSIEIAKLSLKGAYSSQLVMGYYVGTNRVILSQDVTKLISNL